MTTKQQLIEKYKTIKSSAISRGGEAVLDMVIQDLEESLEKVNEGQIDEIMKKEYNKRDYDLADIFNKQAKSDTKADLYMDIIDYLVDKGFLQKGEHLTSKPKEEVNHTASFVTDNKAHIYDIKSDSIKSYDIENSKPKEEVEIDREKIFKFIEDKIDFGETWTRIEGNTKMEIKKSFNN